MDDLERNIREDRDNYLRERQSRLSDTKNTEETTVEEYDDDTGKTIRSKTFASSISPTYSRNRPILIDESSPTEAYKLNQVIYYLASILVAILGLRFLFLLFGANAANSFVNFIYQITDPLVSPFRGMFPSNTNLAGVNQFDSASLVAIVAVLVVTFLLTGLIILLNQRSDDSV